MSEHASAWKPLIDEWVARERRLRPDAPVRPDSVRVRDSLEVDDQAFVLVSYDVEYPWPQEEDTPADQRSHNTAVLQAMRVRVPWIERDATRARAHLVTAMADVTVAEHVLGARRAFSGHAPDAGERVTLHFEDGHEMGASVVDGWFLAVVPEEWRIDGIEIGGERQGLARADVAPSPDLFGGLDIDRPGSTEMYFSPLDLRNVQPLVRWERVGNIVVVASSLEQYDEGGIVRLRIDGVRTDDDLFVTWPEVRVEADGRALACGRCGEFAFKDTLSIDVGFKPWLAPDTDRLTLVVGGLRGAEGPIDEVRLELALRSSAQ